MTRRVYLASPYSHPDEDVRVQRYKAACEACAAILQRGLLAFSPITHSHVLAATHNLPNDFDFWQNWCLSYLRHWATELCILDIDGWMTSRGVTSEIMEARKLGLPIYRFT